MTKLCIKCNQELETKWFRKDGSSSDGFKNECKICRSSKMYKIDINGRECRICNEYKPYSEYGRNDSGAGGYEARCRSCISQKRYNVDEQGRECMSCQKYKLFEEYPKNPKGGHRARCLECSKPNYKIEDHRLRAYNLTDQEFKKILLDQAGLCKICLKQDRLVVDHDHNTGKVRGLLCNKCNSGIGQLMDQYEYIVRAAEYLKPFTE